MSRRSNNDAEPTERCGVSEGPLADAQLALSPTDPRLASWQAFLVAHADVNARLERELAAAEGLTLSWYDVLLQLAQAPAHRLRMSELAEEVLLSRSGLTRLVDRMEADGLVRRESAPCDGRGTYTVLTRRGLQRFREAMPVHLAGISRHWVERFSTEELDSLATLLGRLADPCRVDEESGGRPSCGGDRPDPAQR